MPNAKIIVTIAGSPSGIAATAKEIDVNSMSNHSRPLNIPTPNITTATIKIAIVKYFPKRFKFSCKGVIVSSEVANISAILPTSVFIPVPTTIPSPRP